APVRDLRVARPDLLAVDDEDVAVALAARPEGGQIGAGARLGEPLTPEVGAGEERAEEAAALRVGPMVEDRRADQIDVRTGGRAGGADPVERLLEEPALHDGRAAAAVLPRPRDRRPAALVELPLPRARDLEPRRIVGARPAVVATPLARDVRLEPATRLLGECELALREREVHATFLGQTGGRGQASGFDSPRRHRYRRPRDPSQRVRRRRRRAPALSRLRRRRLPARLPPRDGVPRLALGAVRETPRRSIPRPRPRPARPWGKQQAGERVPLGALRCGLRGRARGARPRRRPRG